MVQPISAAVALACTVDGFFESDRASSSWWATGFTGNQARCWLPAAWHNRRAAPETLPGTAHERLSSNAESGFSPLSRGERGRGTWAGPQVDGGLSSVIPQAQPRCLDLGRGWFDTGDLEPPMHRRGTLVLHCRARPISCSAVAKKHEPGPLRRAHLGATRWWMSSLMLVGQGRRRLRR